MKNKKTYEVPVLTVTELETEDVILVSRLVGSEININDILGSGEIQWDLIK